MNLTPLLLLLSAIFLSSAVRAQEAPADSVHYEWDVLLTGGHVIDARNGIDKVLDVAIVDSQIVAVAAGLDPTQAERVVDATGLYVTPGLIDLQHARLLGNSRGVFAPG